MSALEGFQGSDVNLHVSPSSCRFRLLQGWPGEEPRLPRPSTAAAAAASSGGGGRGAVLWVGRSHPQPWILSGRGLGRGHGARGGPLSESRPAAHVDARPEV